MNGTSIPAAKPVVSTEETLPEIEASCATPVSLLFFASLAWLVVSALFAVIASVKLHAPAILANSFSLSYGHDKALANDAFAYGFASQAGVAILLWILCRLGRVRLFGPLSITIATLFWNFGVALGAVGVLRGDSTGFEWLELPSYGSAIFFASYLVIAACAFVTFARRRYSELYPSQWYILAALLWFPWLYTSARLLLVWYPVRGAMQFLVNSWYVNGLFTLWLGAIAIACLYYFIPKLTNGQLLHSRPLAAFGFWTFALFSPWGGLYRGVPLPAWVVSVSIAGSVLTIGPLIAVVINLWESRRPAASECTRIWFTTSLVFFALSGILIPAIAMCPISAVTVVAEGAQVVALYGFIGFALFGAIYHIAPRLFIDEITCGTRGKVTWWCTLLGIILFSGPLIVGGLMQGHNLRASSVPFVNIMNGLKPFLRISTLGLLLLLVGNISIFASVTRMLCACCRNCCCPREKAPVKTKLKPAKAR